jgi:hypothetical protein
MYSSGYIFFYLMLFNASPIQIVLLALKKQISTPPKESPINIKTPLVILSVQDVNLHRRIIESS